MHNGRQRHQVRRELFRRAFTVAVESRGSGCYTCCSPRHTVMSFIPSYRTRVALIIAALVSTLGAYGCAVGEHRLVAPQPPAAEASAGPSVSWLAPELARDVTSLSRWRRSVGPAVAVKAETASQASDQLVVVNWNMHVGGGDLHRLFADVRRQAGPSVPIVFLLQEAYRSGPEVPTVLDRDATFASVIRGLRKDGGREEIEALAASLGLHTYYVPSMRNGGPLTSDEDRGNAILSTVPLADLAAIELPFERQRRVAVAATVSGSTARGRPWRLRVVSAHLDNMVGARRLWIAGGESARTRQARGLLAALGTQAPLVLGADLNTWFGFRDGAYREAAQAFPETQVTDRRATFRGMLRLDHLFFRLDDGWRAAYRRADDRYDSDHYPLIGTIDFADSTN